MSETPAGSAGVPVSGRPSPLHATFTPRQRHLAELGLLLVMLSWAVNFITVKGTGTQIPPMTFAWVRFTAAGLGALVLAEPIRADQVAGGLIIVAGVLLTRRGGSGRSPEAVAGTSSLPPE